jgi:hypothetical protein
VLSIYTQKWENWRYFVAHINELCAILKKLLKMNIYTEMKPENLKDTFYLFGIFSTFIISVVTVIIAIKNRKNSLRENLFKEQLNFVAKLTAEFYNLHSDLTKISKGKEKNHVETDNKIENIFGVMFSNTHLGCDNILIKASETLNSVNDYLKSVEEKKSETTNEKFKTYFKNYKELTNIMRNEMGIHSLSKENEKLFK